MIGLLRALHAEGLKTRRTLAVRMVFVTPALVALLGIFTQSARLSRGGAAGAAAQFWEAFSRESLAIWAIFVMPLFITLETALVAGLEHAERHWKHLFALPVSRHAIYAAKLLVVQGLTLSSTLVVCAFVVLSGWVLIVWHPALAAAGPAPLWSILGRALLCWLAAGLLVSAHLWIAIRWPSFTVALGAGIAGTFFALFAASAKAGRYYPWLLPVNVLTSADRLPVALAMGIGGGLLVAVLGSIDFVRREEEAPPGLGRISTALWGVALAGLAAWAVALQNGPSPSPRVAARIERVERGLLPNVALTGKDAGTVPGTLAERMKVFGVPGVSIAVFRREGLEWAKGYGVREAGGASPIDEETRFQAASISKPVAAMTALALVQKGVLALDEDVNLRLRSFKVPESPFTAREKVTLRRLLNHSAGVAPSSSDGYPAAERLPRLTDLLGGLAPTRSGPLRIDFEPGSRFEYAGLGYALVQQLIEDTTGRRFADVAQEMVLAKLDMRASAFSQPLRADWAARSASGHKPDGSVYAGRWRNHEVLAAAGLWTTPSDLAKFAIELRRALAGESSRVLGRDVARLMVTPLQGDYGLGLQLIGGSGGPASGFQHAGANPGYRSVMLCRIDSGDGVVVMTNGDGGSVLVPELLRSVAREYGWKGLEPASRVIVAMEPSKLAEYAGRYDSAEGVLNLELEGSKLYLSAPELTGGRWQLHPLGPDRFLLAEEDEEITFVRGSAGRISGLRSAAAGGRTFSAERAD